MQAQGIQTRRRWTHPNHHSGPSSRPQGRTRTRKRAQIQTPTRTRTLGSSRQNNPRNQSAALLCGNTQINAVIKKEIQFPIILEVRLRPAIPGVVIAQGSWMLPDNEDSSLRCCLVHSREKHFGLIVGRTIPRHKYGSTTHSPCVEKAGPQA